jgi:hypothetical protein
MTFSLRPRSLSVLPRTAAAMSTRVVSWKEAADRNESLESEILVTGSSSCVKVAGCLPSASSFVVLDDALARHDLAGDKQAVARLFDLDAAEHLANDHLDVLVGDDLALGGVDGLDLGDDVALDGVFAGEREHFLEVDRAFGEALAGVTRSPVRTSRFWKAGTCTRARRRRCG